MIIDLKPRIFEQGGRVRNRIDMMAALGNIKNVVIHALHAKLHARATIVAHAFYFVFVHPIGPCFKRKPDELMRSVSAVVFLE